MPSAHHNGPTLANSDNTDDNRFFVVGIGASAGGLQALEEFFENVPQDIGAAFVVIQHLSPSFKSLMQELLQRKTALRVYQIEDGMKIMPDSVYVIPPQTNIVVSEGCLCFQQKEPERINFPIDIFFESLAQAYRDRAMGVLLSGTGSDGTKGLQAIGEAGGLALIQSPETAQFSGMPANALPTGLVDEVLSPHDLAQTIYEIVRITLNIPLAEQLTENLIDPAQLNHVLGLLNDQQAVDFSQYKIGTLSRRIYHRCALNNYQSLQTYITYLESSEPERQLLIQDFLIGSTRFFRDLDAWHFIETNVLPPLIESLDDHQQLRIWVAGCATGEEAYTMAILADEAVRKANRALSIKIFATDLDNSSLETASKGIYPLSIRKDISVERLERYFITKSEGYQVHRQLRELLIFAPHNLAQNAGFSKMNLISCRNVLIYMKPQLQQQVLRMLHFSLASEGILFLGGAEVLGPLAGEFSTLHSKWKMYQKQRDSQLTLAPITRTPLVALPLSPTSFKRAQPRSDRILGQVFSFCFGDRRSTCLLINESNKLLRVFYDGADLLRLPLGEANLDVISIVPPPLQLPLSTALHRAKREQAAVLYAGIRLSDSDNLRTINLKVGIESNESQKGKFLIVLLEEEARHSTTISDQTFEVDAETINQIGELEYELQQTRENLQTTIEELETTNEEQQATNEELIASNEELQSTNEELHSVNEELYTVNAEYQSKIQELLELNNDLDNLLRSTDIGVVFLDLDLNIRKYTPAATKAISLREGDIDRPLTELSHNLMCPPGQENAYGLIELLQQALTRRQPIEQEMLLQSSGSQLLLRVNLYWDEKGDCQGLVLSFIDIDDIKQVEETLHRRSEQLRLVTDAIPAWISYVDAQRYCRLSNQAYDKWFERPSAEVEGLHLASVLGEALYQQVFHYVDTVLSGQEVSFDIEFPSLEQDSGWVNVNYIPHRLASGEVKGFFALASDISDRKAVERMKDEFLSVVSHELRTPLTGILGMLQLLSEKHIKPDSENGEEAIRIAYDNSVRLMSIVRDILELESLESGRIQLSRAPINTSVLLSQATKAVQVIANEKKITLNIATQEIEVYADEGRLIQVLINLLSNAIKFSEPNSNVSLSAERQDHDVLFAIKDEGTGIPENRLEDIFERFQQVDSTDSRQKGGTGLGLAICRQIIGQHNGRIWAESVLGEGSQFFFTIPFQGLEDEQ
ncbi:PAS domain-containing protein [Leptolyngbya cf. ectocarpi LEGE 11479]|uniref:histidine kinase n=1 Tax=Leptolyngbya cf. ectocarpi LEGE 11479 TaxID=1828722 RepID=A0A928ZWU7_LEPEC|nr:chemotaxis protein CheB [Leptolyngbya ectocarpi]MBE9068911.1 PAS domain-containing protein [Leptolyngbya cf. ectocarpi LEGE 11479]